MSEGLLRRIPGLLNVYPAQAGCTLKLSLAQRKNDHFSDLRKFELQNLFWSATADCEESVALVRRQILDALRLSE
ncbi:hypothetical protein CEE37_09710 [candidate division LCP-89 bacterium B3_LCP]|uniref:Uncharacterized protein n=1 Tax=candidate division LCP-89 bacterium B3_LCP TaxID=2012998 RepID=A0A532UYL3_UNCL8|nr:MAG: hypothetical protein CEE37_09710 [candidate division LCP-89 bacterium B3_LCP]